MGRRQAVLLLALLLALDLMLRFARLDAPALPVFDEGVFYLDAARAYLDGRPDPNFEHPPLSKVAIAAGIRVFGDTPLGWRSASALAGTAGVLLTYLLGAALWGRREAGLIAAALLACETLWFLLSRLAMLDPLPSAGLLAALLCGWRYRIRGRPGDLAASGIVLGLAAAAKWSAVLGLIPLMLAIVAAPAAGLQPVRRVFRAAAVSALAVATYLLVFLTFSDVGPAGLFERHIRMITYQTAAGVEGAGLWDRLGPPLLWLVDLPLRFTAREDERVWVLALAHPLVLWPGILAVAALARRAWRDPSGPAAYLVAAVLALYLPWLFTARARYSYYLLPVMPLLCIALSGALLNAQLFRRPPTDPKQERRQRLALILGYLTSVALGFAALYPAVTGLWR